MQQQQAVYDGGNSVQLVQCNNHVQMISSCAVSSSLSSLRRRK